MFRFSKTLRLASVPRRNSYRHELRRIPEATFAPAKAFFIKQTASMITKRLLLDTIKNKKTGSQQQIRVKKDKKEKPPAVKKINRKCRYEVKIIGCFYYLFRRYFQIFSEIDNFNLKSIFF